MHYTHRHLQPNQPQQQQQQQWYWMFACLEGTAASGAWQQ
jgi:CHASE1-domain containing sensor protein